ncbi:serine/arginine-rich splicing factor 4-like isoform X2 [Nerophis ophidion]|uniref:serine/arginine-rich splicing factor 4-like isoform X2 n=1 Tax=Nerophis ophidion TaxID=159077 RepID=UPI002ADF3A6B|nr:serine/arginine-rich splicing factor 4-like isoform X2 [Nerophis ophidion]
MTSQQQQSSLNLRMGLRKRSRKRRHPNFITSASLPLEPVFETSAYRRGSSSRRRSKSRSLSMSPSMSTSRSLSMSTSKSRSRSGSKDRSRSKHKKARSTFRDRTRSKHKRARSTSRDKSRNKHQYTTSTKDDDPKFPMEEGKFQKRVFFLLMDMRATISDLGKKYEPVDSQFHVEMINRRKGLAQLERKLADGDYRKLLTSRLRKIGGSSLEDNVKNVMKRVLTNWLLAQLNIEGAPPKKKFKVTRLSL